MAKPDATSTWAEKFSVAISGIREAWRLERSFRVHGAGAALTIALAVGLEVSSTDWALLALAIGLVTSAELANTAIETVVDLVQPDLHPLAKRAKDIAAGAVLLAAIAAFAVGGSVFLPPLMKL